MEQKAVISAYDWTAHQWELPQKLIREPADLEKFKHTESYRSFMEFICHLQRSVESKPASSVQDTPKFAVYHELLDRLIKLVDEVPPIQQKMRFGNVAYKDWHNKAMMVVSSEQTGDEFFDKLLPEVVKGAKEELMVYFSDSFGSNVRLDYGTGHEQNFMQILFILFKLGLIAEQDFAEVALKVFFKYIRLMRKIQTVYWLEPAGSQGVWGLDDHHFMPFLLGASQLINHPEVKLPKDALNRDLLEKNSNDYLYLSSLCITRLHPPHHEHQVWGEVPRDQSSAVRY